MSGLAILVVAIFAAALTGMFTRVKNQKTTTGVVVSVEHKYDSGEKKLFDWKLPIPSVPGSYFSTEIKLFAKLDIAADVTIGQSNETVYTVGICFIRGDFEA